MSGDYLAGLRIRIEPGPGAVASLRGVLLVVPTIEPGQEEALDALLTAATVRPVVRAVARVVADFDRDRLPAFCLVVEGEGDAPFALVHGPVVLTARGGGDDVRLDGLASRFWVDHALPTVLERLAVHAVGDGEDASTDRLVLEATVAAGLADRSSGDTPEVDTPVPPVPVETGGFGSGAPAAEPVAEPPAEPIAEPVVEPVAVRVPETVPDATSVMAAVSAADAPADAAAPGDATADEADDVEDSTAADDADDAADAEDAHDAEDADVSAERGRAVMAAPAVAPGGGSSSAGFRAEPIRFGQGGRMESVAPPAQPAQPAPPTTVNGWHEEPAAVATAVTAAPEAPDVVDRAPEEAATSEPAAATGSAPGSVPEVVPEPAASSISTGAPSAPAGPSPFAAPPESPFAAPARTPFVPAADSPFAAPADRREPEAPGLPVRRPQTSMPPQAATQLVAPPAPGLFPGAVPPPVQPGFDPFSAAAPRPPEQDLLREPAADQRPGGEHPGNGRPRRGRLIMENGPDVVVDSDCVIGRNPEVDPDVAQGRAKPVVLPDAEQRISRVHARLVFTEGGVEIVDAGSVNGTWIEPPGGAGWIAMVPRVPAPLPLGSRIQVGDLVLSYSPVDDDA